MSITHLIHLNNFLGIRTLKIIELNVWNTECASLSVCDVWYHSTATDLVCRTNKLTRQVILYFPGVVLTYDESHSITEAISMIALYYYLFICVYSIFRNEFTVCKIRRRKISFIERIQFFCSHWNIESQSLKWDHFFVFLWIDFKCSVIQFNKIMKIHTHATECWRWGNRLCL